MRLTYYKKPIISLKSSIIETFFVTLHAALFLRN